MRAKTRNKMNKKKKKKKKKKINKKKKKKMPLFFELLSRNKNCTHKL